MNNRNDKERQFDESVKIIAEAKIDAPVGFKQKVMTRLEEESQTTFSWRYIMEKINQYLIKGSAGLAACAVLFFCFQFVTKNQSGLLTDNAAIFPKVAESSSATTTGSEAYDNFNDSIEEIEKDITNRNVELDKNLDSIQKRRDEDQKKAKKILNQLIEGQNKSVSTANTEIATHSKDSIESAPAPMAKGLSEVQARTRSFAGKQLPLSQNNLGRTTSYFNPELDRRFPTYHNLNNEKYSDITENSPTLVKKEAVSTFSIDVDTGSYTNARRFLSRGNLPPTNSVRIEEFINYFSYNYPAQTEKPFGYHYEIAPNPLGKDKYLLKLGIKAKNISQERKKWNLVFLVDVSGSMNAPDKLPLVKDSLKYLTKSLKSSDRISIVSYAGSSRLVLESTSASEKTKINAAIDSLQLGGGTHGSAGIHEAYKQARLGFKENGVNRVILATDGDFNVGVTSNDELIKIIEEKRKQKITLTTVGFGTGNYNEAMMEQLANKGNGNYFYIDNFREAKKVFGKDLAGTIEVVAKDVKLQLEFNPQTVAQYRLIGYENRKLENHQFNDDTIDAGEIGSSHTVTALYELVLANTEAAKKLSIEHRYEQNKPKDTFSKDGASQNELAFLKIRYKEPKGDTSKLLTLPLMRDNVKNSTEAASKDFFFVSAVSAFAHKLRKSKYASKVSIDEIIRVAKSSRGKDEDGNRAEFINLMENVSQKID